MSESLWLEKLKKQEPQFWANPFWSPFEVARKEIDFTPAEVEDARDRLARFAPLLAELFPETGESGGIFESPLREIPAMQQSLCEKSGAAAEGRLFLKLDSHLPVSGSVKARGGIYEVLKHAEELALKQGFLCGFEDDYRKLLAPECRAFFGTQKIQVGSTGNLGLSIGLMGAALGFEAVVHMSADAKAWKKDLLRKRGAKVIEYSGNYSEAVKTGRAASLLDPNSYFVDDESSRELFLGYAVAGERLKAQLEQAKIPVDRNHPLLVYLPCGVGGAPGGISFGLKLAFGDAVLPFFAEPTAAPCMLLGLASGKKEKISVEDAGLSGKTEADGLAVGRCSGLVSRTAEHYLEGAFTVRDESLGAFLKELYRTEKLFLEPSACAGFAGPAYWGTEEGRKWLEDRLTPLQRRNALHLVWATGGSMVPRSVRKALLS